MIIEATELYLKILDFLSFETHCNETWRKYAYLKVKCVEPIYAQDARDKFTAFLQVTSQLRRYVKMKMYPRLTFPRNGAFDVVNGCSKPHKFFNDNRRCPFPLIRRFTSFPGGPVIVVREIYLRIRGETLIRKGRKGVGGSLNERWTK